MYTKTENRRLFPRVEMRTPVHYHVRGASTASTCVLNDISDGGINFVDQQYLVPATVVNLEISLLSRIIHAAAKVAWVAPMAHSYRYSVGVQFLEMDPVEKRFLSDYIKMRLGQF